MNNRTTKAKHLSSCAAQARLGCPSLFKSGLACSTHLTASNDPDLIQCLSSQVALSPGLVGRAFFLRVSKAFPKGNSAPQALDVGHFLMGLAHG